MPADTDIVSVAQAIGEPARAAILLQLMDGRPHTAGDLAAAARIVPSTATPHLRRLRDAGLITVIISGRQRLHTLAGPHVAALIEAIASITPPTLPLHHQPTAPSTTLLAARACYGHLAGHLGVAIANRLTADGIVPALSPGETGAVHSLDHPLLRTLGITALPRNRPTVRACLDWSHQTTHLSGALGSALLTHLLSHKWLRRRPASGRALHITRCGRRQLELHVSNGLPPA
jgi:DNA-binding transcriptional ArsR family regulator